MEEVKNTILSIVDTSRSRRALPDTTETTGSTRGYVYYGKDNNFPNFVNELYKECSTLRSIIDGTAEYIQGNGVLCSEKWETVNRNGGNGANSIEYGSLQLLLGTAMERQV